MVGQLIHHLPVEATRFREGIEEQRLIEPPHHDDPIESLAIRRKADVAVRAAEKAANLLVKRRRGAPVQELFGFAGAPPEICGREVEIRIRYRSLELEGALACEKNQRSMGFDDLDAIYSGTVGGRIFKKGDDVSLIFAQERLYKV
jgi:hypothetical protein